MFFLCFFSKFFQFSNSGIPGYPLKKIGYPVAVLTENKSPMCN